MSTDDPPRPLRQGHYRAGIIGLGGIAVNRGPRDPSSAGVRSGQPGLPPGFLNNDDIKLFMDEVIPHFA